MYTDENRTESVYRRSDMEFIELARTRYSERSFDSRPIEDEKLARIL